MFTLIQENSNSMSNLHNRQHGVQLLLAQLNLQFHFLRAIGTRALALLVISGALLPATPAFAGTLPLSLDVATGSYSLAQCFDVLEDTRSTYRVVDLEMPVIAAQFHPAAVEGDVNFGYTASAYWLRCSLITRSAGAWLLEIGYPTLDHVQVYTPLSNGSYRMQESGDHLPFSTRVYPHRNFVFPLEFTPGTTTIYLRVQSEGALTIPATLWSPYIFYQQNIIAYSIFSVYYGIFIALGLYNLLSLFSLRDRVYLEYVLFVVFMAIGQASLNGFGNQFLWPEWTAWGDVALPVGFSISGLFGVMFTRSFLATASSAPRLNRVLWGFVIFFAAAALTTLFSYRGGSMLTSLCGLGYSIFACWIGVYYFRRKHREVRYFILAWTLLLIGVGATSLRNFGWLPTNFFTMYAMQIGSSLEMLFLSFALADRIQTLRNEKELAQADAIATRQKMVDTLRHNEQSLEVQINERTHQLTDAMKMLEISLQQEKDGRETQANLLALMAHEIRSPVAVIGNTAQMLNVLAQAEQPGWQPRIEKIMDAVRQLAKLMDNFLAEDRLSMKSAGLELQEGDLNVFCTKLVDTLAISHNRAIRYEPYGGDARLSADWQLIGIAIGNLIDNAVKYSPQDGEISLRVLPGTAGTLCVGVTDHGAGIAPELQQRIFEKFIRGKHGSSIRGSGLGLYLVNWIAKFHGGYTEVSSVVGTGSTFRLCLLQRKQS